MAEQSPEAFGELLRRYRIAAGLSQEALAERAGLSAHGISDLERGARRFPCPGHRPASRAHAQPLSSGICESSERRRPQPAPCWPRCAYAAADAPPPTRCLDLAGPRIARHQGASTAAVSTTADVDRSWWYRQDTAGHRRCGGVNTRICRWCLVCGSLGGARRRVGVADHRPRTWGARGRRPTAADAIAGPSGRRRFAAGPGQLRAGPGRRATDH